MNTHDIELPPLPVHNIFEAREFMGSVRVMPVQTAQDYARTGIEPYAKRIAELEAQIEADRKRTGGPVANTHTDDDAVDHFAAAMKKKLAQARQKGRAGWHECDPKDLSAMLRKHVEKGDPRDVANFCMFLWSLGQPIAPQPADRHRKKYLAGLAEADGCFRAAYAEGLSEALSETADMRLKDLIERRILYAHHAVVEAITQPAEPTKANFEEAAETCRAMGADAFAKCFEGVAQPAESMMWPKKADEGMLRAMMAWRESDEREGLSGEAAIMDRVYHALHSYMRDRGNASQAAEIDVEHDSAPGFAESAAAVDEADRLDAALDYMADHRRLVRELDVLLNGDGAAEQASLCDIVAQVRRFKADEQTKENRSNNPYYHPAFSGAMGAINALKSEPPVTEQEEETWQQMEKRKL